MATQQSLVIRARGTRYLSAWPILAVTLIRPDGTKVSLGNVTVNSATDKDFTLKVSGVDVNDGSAVGITFTNDDSNYGKATKARPNGDRNFWITSIKLDGTEVLSGAPDNWNLAQKTFTLPIVNATVSAPLPQPTVPASAEKGIRIKGTPQAGFSYGFYSAWLEDGAGGVVSDLAKIQVFHSAALDTLIGTDRLPAKLAGLRFVLRNDASETLAATVLVDGAVVAGPVTLPNNGLLRYGFPAGVAGTPEPAAPSTTDPAPPVVTVPSEPATSTPSVPAEPAAIPSDVTGTQARMAHDLVLSIGVNTHVADGVDDAVVAGIKEMGILNVRDGSSADAGFMANLAKLQQQTGARLTLITDSRSSTESQLTAMLKQLGGSTGVRAITNINEPDLNGRSGSECAVWQAAMKRAASGMGIALVGPSVCDGGGAASFAGCAVAMEAIDLHTYYASHMPETGGWGADGYGSLEWATRVLGLPVAGKTMPVWATECGNHNAITAKAVATNGHRGVSEAVAAKFEPRMFMNHFDKGVVCSFKYDMKNDFAADPDNPEANFGWLRQDNSRKPAFYAVKRLIAALADPGASFAPGKLDMKLSGSTSDLRTVLLQNRVGQFFLVFWLAKECWNDNARTDITNQTQAVTLTLSRDVRAAEVQVTDQGDAWGTVARGGAAGARTYGLTARDSVSILRLTP